LSLQFSQALIKLPLEECIRELEADNAEGALGHASLPMMNLTHSWEPEIQLDNYKPVNIRPNQ
jgi:hypothetical protein